MRVSVLMLAYNEHELIGPCLRQIPKWIDQILVLASKRPWLGSDSSDAPKTLEVVRGMKDDRIRLLSLDWRTEHDQRNWGMGYLHDQDWVVVLDADEFYTSEGWERLKQDMEDAPKTSGVIRCGEMHTYWKTTDYRWEPSDGHRPVVAIKPSMATFCDKREVPIDILQKVSEGLTMYHLSWVKSDASVLSKIQNWMHAKDFDAQKWYREKWLKWEPSMEDIRPYGVERSRAVYDPVPAGISAYFQ